jgi:hypothetical protein
MPFVGLKLLNLFSPIIDFTNEVEPLLPRNAKAVFGFLFKKKIINYCGVNTAPREANQPKVGIPLDNALVLEKL